MEVYNGQANVLDFPVMDAAGTPIIVGTVNVYLFAKTGTNAGKFYRASDTSWQAAESIAGTATVRGTGGVWTLSLPAAVWGINAQYTAWALESTPSIVVPQSLDCVSPIPDQRLTAHPDAYVMVAPSTTDSGRGTNLLAAYTAAKLLTPGGNALSHSNRAAVLIPPGHYTLVGTLTLNANFVDLIATHPEKGGDRLATDNDYSIDDVTPDGPYYGVTDVTTFRPPRTVISFNNVIPTVVQTVADVRMDGFGIANLWALGLAGALKVSATSNDPSIYDRMYLWSGWFLGSTIFTQHVGGLWRNCIANSLAWRVGVNGEFRATMIDCQAGAQSYGGDAEGGSFTTCLLLRCKCLGLQIQQSYSPFVPVEASGFGGFGGCQWVGIPSTRDSWFVENESGPNSFSIGCNAAGNYIRCRAKEFSYGATGSDSAFPGSFTGYAEESYGEGGSFGGCYGEVTLESGNYCGGHLVRCTVRDTGGELIHPTQLKGATIEGGLFTTKRNNKDCFKLLDSASKVHNATILVVEGGTGIPINDDGTARTVSAAGNRYNNLTAAATGLGANVTNRGNSGEERVRKAIPDATSGTSGGLATVDASNRVAGVSGNVTLAALVWAVVAYVRKQSATSDAIGANWFQDVAEATGITLPKVHVRKCSDGSVIVNDAAMTAVTGTTGSFRYVCTGAQRLDKGELYDIRFKATIGGVEYTRGPFKRSRDT